MMDDVIACFPASCGRRSRDRIDWTVLWLLAVGGLASKVGKRQKPRILGPFL